VCNAIAPTILERFESMFPMKIQMENETLFKILSYLETLKISDDSNIRVYSSLIVHSIIESFFQKSVSNTLVPYPIALKNILVKCNDPENLSWKSADVCAYSNYSQTHINRLFKKYLNTSVTEYLTNIKMNAAKNMLTTTNYSISEISASLGYSSVSYFNKIFSKTFDSTPYKYKLKYFKKKEN
ncbi:MAG: helix-turn-helix transcriptional regulator, partial [Bacilli bacterium]|nr:helix-turn-helix transcriptional regulator [Bacilli bacterium]